MIIEFAKKNLLPTSARTVIPTATAGTGNTAATTQRSAGCIAIGIHRAAAISTAAVESNAADITATIEQHRIAHIHIRWNSHNAGNIAGCICCRKGCTCGCRNGSGKIRCVRRLKHITCTATPNSTAVNLESIIAIALVEDAVATSCWAINQKPYRH